MIWSFLRRLIQRYGFFKREPRSVYDLDAWTGTDAFETHPFYTEEKRRNEGLAAIARERDALKDQLAKAIKAKKARAPIYAALRALSIEELNVEGRR